MKEQKMNTKFLFNLGPQKASMNGIKTHLQIHHNAIPHPSIE